MARTSRLLGGAPLAMSVAADALAQDGAVQAVDLGAVLAGKPRLGGPNEVMRNLVASRSRRQALAISKIKPHRHAPEDRVVCVAEGAGGDDLVLSAMATVGWKPPEDAKFHE